MAIDFKNDYATGTFNLVTGAVNIQHLTGKENDTGAGVFIEMRDASNALVPPSVETMILYATRPDGTKVYFVAEYDDNRMRIDFNNSLYEVSGNVTAKIHLIDINGLTKESNTFTINAIESVFDASYVRSTDDFRVLTETLDNVTEALDNVNNANDIASDLLDTFIPRIENIDIDYLERILEETRITPEDFDLYMDDEARLLYLTVMGSPISSGVLIPEGGGGGGGGGSVASMRLMNTTGWSYNTLTEGSQVKLSFNWSSKEDDVETGSGIMQVLVNGGVRITKSVEQGSMEVDVTGFMSGGTNLVSIRVTDAYGTMRLLSYRISILQINIRSSFNSSLILSSDFIFNYIPTGEANKEIKFIIDGVVVSTVTTTSNNREMSIILPKQTHGSHTLEVYFTAEVESQIITSNKLYYDIMFVDVGNTSPIITSEFTRTDFSQLDTAIIKYRVYTPDKLSSDVNLYANGVLIESRTVQRGEETWAYRFNDAIPTELEIVSGVTTKTFNFNVAELILDVEAETHGLSLHLTSTGRNNSQSNKDVWEFGETKAVFTGFNWNTDGWQLDEYGATVLRVSGGGRVNIPFNMFKNDFKNTGKTIEIEFATRDVLDYDSTVISSESGGIGINITAQRAFLNSEQVEMMTQYKEDEHVRLSFVIDKISDHRLVMCYVNGILSRAIQYPISDNFAQGSPVGITIGADRCTTEIYNIRVYENNLSRNQILENWIADTQFSDVLLERYNDNDIYDDYDNIIIDKLPEGLPYLILSAPILPQSKGDKKTVSGQYVDPMNSTRSFTFEGAQADVQGTSSAGYARKNYKIKFNSGITINGVKEDGFAIREGAIKESVFTFKADVASSEGANNTELVRIYNDSNPFKTPPQKLDSRIRQGIDGFPIVIFHDDGVKTKFVGKYNFNNDKSNTDTFGLSTGDQSWEILNNTSNRVLFKSGDFTGDGWKNDFEARYPEDSEYISDLAELGSWIASTDQSQATNGALSSAIVYDGVTHTHDTAEYRLAKFKNQAKDKFEFDSLIFDYVFTELFLMVDQRAKNAFPTKFHNSKWCFLPYDMDTALGTNNEGALAFDYHLEDIDEVYGTDVYNGQKSVLWINVRQAFYEDIRRMYQDLRAIGTLSYKNVSEIFTEHQSQWSEAIFNEDAYFKYLEPLFNNNEGIYLSMVQGSKAEQRKWWLYNRFRYLDAKYNAGDSLSDFITLRGYALGDITVEPYADIYATIKYGSYLTQERALRGSEYTLHCPLDNMNDTEIYIYSASQLRSVGDLSMLNVGLAEFAHANKLESIKVGDNSPSYRNTRLTELTVGNNTLLRTIDATNCVNLKTPVDLSGCVNIEDIYMAGTSVTGVVLPNGGRVRNIYLPNTITNLSLVNLKGFNSLNVADYKNINALRIENTPNINLNSILADASNLSRLRLINVDFSLNNTGDLTRLSELSGIDENNSIIPNSVITGKVHLTTVIREALPILEARFPELEITYTTMTENPTVTFKNWNGEILKTQVVAYGGDATAPSNPTKPKDSSYAYLFEQWDKAFTEVKTDLVITAIYTPVPYFTVRFENWNGTLLNTQDVVIGEDALDPITSGFITTPTKEDGGLIWVYEGWTGHLTNITENRTIVASYINEIPESWWKLATDDDFSGTSNGNFRYIGTDDFVIIPSTIKGISPTSYSNMFNGKTAKGVRSTNNNITNMNGMFQGSQATFLDLSGLDTSNVTNMNSMFYNSKATSLDLSGFDTSNVTDMRSMFYFSQATSLDLSSFNTSNVTNMNSMFANSQVTSLDLSSFNTSNVTDMRSMFTSLKATSLDLSNFDTSNVDTMSSMFQGSQVTSLDLSSFDTSKVTHMTGMFTGSQATFLDLSSFNTSNVINMSSMFYNSQVTSLDLSSFNTSNVTNMNSMFANTQATFLDLSSFDTNNVTDMGGMLSQSRATYLNLSSFDFVGTVNVGGFNTFSNNTKILYVKEQSYIAKIQPQTSAIVVYKSVLTKHEDLTAIELNQIFTDLPTITETKTLDMKLCAGILQADITIATNKGWTIVTT